MVLARYILYLAGFALVLVLVTSMETGAPGSLGFDPTPDRSGFAPLQIMQVVVLLVCGLLYVWVAANCPSQRPIAIPFCGFAAVSVLIEVDDWLDDVVTENFGEVTIAVVGAAFLVYAWRQLKRLRIAWIRIWPSSGVTLLFAGAIINFVAVPLVGNEALWLAIAGRNADAETLALASSELLQTLGYFFWLAGTIEYTYQARAIALRTPVAAAAKRRERRRPGTGRF